MKSKLRILELEDNSADAELIRHQLQAEGISCDISYVKSQRQFLAALEKGAFDLILADFSMPGFDGFSTLARARGQRPEIPFIFVSGPMDEEVGIATLNGGAAECVRA